MSKDPHAFSGSARPNSTGERELIRRIGPLIESAANVPSGDDMAAADGAGLLWTTDVLMDGVDFDSARHSWRAIGRKALAVNLSDCAAMGVRPVAALAALVLCEAQPVEAGVELMSGAAELAVRFACPIRGGDTNTWAGKTVIGFTVAGRADPGTRPILRGGAQPGESIFVSGKVGGSLLGRHMTFEPRVELGLELSRRKLATAMIDISDGLSLDLSRLLEASGCGALLDEAALESAIHPDALRRAQETGRAALDHALSDGEDFELIVCARAEHRAALEELGLIALGMTESAAGMRLRRPAGHVEPLIPQGWEHALGRKTP